MEKFTLEQQVLNYVSLIVSSFTMTEVKFDVMFSTFAQPYILYNLMNDREMLRSCPASFSEYNNEWLFLYDCLLQWSLCAQMLMPVNG